VAQPEDPAAVWTGLLQAIQTRPGLAWLRNMVLRSIDASEARFGPRPGLREAANFAAQPRNRDTIEHLLQQVTGRRLRAVIDTHVAASSDEDEAPTTPAASVVQRGLTREEREQAMNLPTVKELQQLFDVTLIDARDDDDAPLESDRDSEQ
jgi:hypothetical protein